jgi:carboxyl-terminal processing protease
VKSFLVAYKMKVYISYIFYLLILLCCEPGVCAPLSKQNANSQDLNLIGEVANIIETEYVNKVDESQLAEAAVLGMLQSLDGYATYLKPEEYSRVLMNTSGSFGGLGIEIIKEGSFLHITGVVDNAPASKAGVEIGDIITHINNKPVAKMTLIAALNAMRGKAGKRVQLKIFRARQKKIIPFNLTCAYIKIESVKLKIENDIAIIRIAFFNQKTSRELSEIIRQGIINAQTKIRGLIIDLRDNPGGLLTEGVKVAGLFLNKGSKILSIRDKNNTEIEAFHAMEKKDIISGMPIAILVNANSASAAEIFTGALRHHKRAIVIGETTMGKGAVQDIIPLQTVPGAARENYHLAVLST